MPAAADSRSAASATESKIYQSFQVAHYEGNRRILQRRNTLDKAKALAKEIANRLSRDGARAQYLTEKDRRVLILAQTATAPLGLEVDEVCRRYAEFQARLTTGTLDEAVSFYLAHGQRVRHGATIASVYAEYLEHLAKRGVGHYHLRDTKRYVGGIVDAFPGLISAVQTTDIDAYLMRLGGSARNKNNHRRAVISFFNFAQEKGFLPHGILHAAAATTDYRDARSQITSEQQALDLIQPTDIYSPDEMRKILAAADDTLRPTLEIKAFSGARTEEVTRLGLHGRLQGHLCSTHVLLMFFPLCCGEMLGQFPPIRFVANVFTVDGALPRNIPSLWRVINMRGLNKCQMIDFLRICIHGCILAFVVIAEILISRPISDEASSFS